MPSLDSRTQQWKRVLKECRIGPASQIEAAREFTRGYPDRSEGWMVLADALVTLGRHREATSALERAERLAGPTRRREMFEQWGHLNLAKGDLRRAESWYRKALKTKPSTRGHVFVGVTLARQGLLAKAEVQQRQAIRLATHNEPVEEAHYNLALLLRSGGKYDQARQHLQMALSMDSKYQLARLALRDIENVLTTTGQANIRMQPTRRVSRGGARLIRRR
jgi:tetratricopeptide (TPR) repeat protein